MKHIKRIYEHQVPSDIQDLIKDSFVKISDDWNVTFYFDSRIPVRFDHYSWFSSEFNKDNILIEIECKTKPFNLGAFINVETIKTLSESYGEVSILLDLIYESLRKSNLDFKSTVVAFSDKYSPTKSKTLCVGISLINSE